MADSFSANFSKEIAKLFSGSARNSASNSSLLSVYHLAFFSVYLFRLPWQLAQTCWITFCNNKNRFFLTQQWRHNIRFYYFFNFSPSQNTVPYLSGWNFNTVDQIFEFSIRLTNWRQCTVLKVNRLKKFDCVYIEFDCFYLEGQKNYEDDLIILDNYNVLV